MNLVCYFKIGYDRIRSSSNSDSSGNIVVAMDGERVH